MNARRTVSGSTAQDDPSVEDSSKQRCHFVQRNLSSSFGKLGHSVGRNPIIFCAAPVMVAAILSVGFYKIQLTKEFEYLFSPVNGRYHKERNAVESLFPPATNGDSLFTATRMRGIASVLIEPKDRGSVLREGVIEEAIRIDKVVYGIKVFWNGTIFTFEDICSKTSFEKCIENEALTLRGKINAIRRKKIFLKYPFEVDHSRRQVSTLAIGFGGVTVDESGNILDAKAIRLTYMIDYTKPGRKQVNLKWEDAFLEEVGRVESNLVKISRETYTSLNKELNRVTEMVAPLLSVTIICIVSFAVLSSMTTNWVTSKPLVAIAGCISPVLGTLSAFGLLLWCEFSYIDVNIAILYIALGIGLDDSFVILSAWRRTDPRSRVEERMKQTYSEAAVSITITSMTNVLSLFIGFGSPYRITRIYCTYASLSMLFAYLYQITFFGGALALSGIREKKNLHSVLFIPVIKETAPDSTILRLLYVGISRDNENCREEYLTYKERVIRNITLPSVRMTVMCCFAVYIASSVYCLTFVEEGFTYKDAAPRHSYLVDYLNTHYRHFTQYPHPIHLVVNKTLDYSDRKVQTDIEEVIRYFNNDPNMAGDKVCICWLRYYLESIRRDVLSFLYRGYNMSDPVDFVSGLREVFLKFPYSKEFRPHIKFNEDKTKIIASRFIIASKNVKTTYDERKLVETLWRKAEDSDYPIYVYNFWFPVYSTLIPVGESCLETLCTATGIVTLVFFIFIPNIQCAISIFITIASILTGVVGYMSLWRVTIDPVSMISLMMSVGLSVDYAAHISYAYLTSKSKCPKEKTMESLRIAGYPIIQGCVSTLLGVAVIAFGPSKMFLVFFKVITLVMLIALFHGLLVIPVAFSTFEIMWLKLKHQIKMRRNGRR